MMGATLRAILSVYDKQGLADFARALAALGFEVCATGKTAIAVAEAGVPVRRIEDVTGHPEMLDGRVKTLHPAIHAGLLADRDRPEHLAQLAEHDYQLVELVAANLYPFQATIESPDVSVDQAIEQIDVGGVTLLRAAAKNFRYVVTVVDPADYPAVVERLRNGTADLSWRRQLAAKAFRHVAVYDTHVAGFLQTDIDEFPESFTVALAKVQDLRYGENPHQRAALYRQTPNPQPGASLAGARQLHGRELSFNNILDVDAAYNSARDFAAPTVAIVKHGNPCGLASAESLAGAYERAHAGDPLSAFGGAVGLNRPVDAETARRIAESHYDDLIAPGFSDEALATLKRRRNLRIIQIDPASASQEDQVVFPWLGLDYRRIGGGFLVQTPDALGEDEVTFRTASEREPTPAELVSLRFAWRAVKHIRSNAIALARGQELVGVGAGQMSRVDAVEIALRKAGNRAAGSVLASDAFFSHPDGPELAARAGVTAMIQPGGALHDEEIIKVANQYNIVMVMTGRRHFRH
jgi:phosphoribosylaminoimidazolecarboxamide formyltransferase/IMP cyclohydrolase